MQRARKSPSKTASERGAPFSLPDSSKREISCFLAKFFELVDKGLLIKIPDEIKKGQNPREAVEAIKIGETFEDVLLYTLTNADKSKSPLIKINYILYPILEWFVEYTELKKHFEKNKISLEDVLSKEIHFEGKLLKYVAQLYIVERRCEQPTIEKQINSYNFLFNPERYYHSDINIFAKEFFTYFIKMMNSLSLIKGDDFIVYSISLLLKAKQQEMLLYQMNEQFHRFVYSGFVKRCREIIGHMKEEDIHLIADLKNILENDEFKTRLKEKLSPSQAEQIPCVIQFLEYFLTGESFSPMPDAGLKLHSGRIPFWQASSVPGEEVAPQESLRLNSVPCGFSG